MLCILAQPGTSFKKRAEAMMHEVALIILYSLDYTILYSFCTLILQVARAWMHENAHLPTDAEASTILVSAV
jgi:hypothetical protein